MNPELYSEQEQQQVKQQKESKNEIEYALIEHAFMPRKLIIEWAMC